MLALARHDHCRWAAIEGRTARSGAPIIVSEPDLLEAARAVDEIGADLARDGWPADAVVVGAFGDPGLNSLVRRCPVPVVGIGGAALREAGLNGRRFSIVTTTPDLETSIRRQVEALELGDALLSIRLTSGAPARVMAHEAMLDEALATCMEDALREDRPDAVLVAGGPLSASAQRLRPRFSVPVIDPVSAAFRHLMRELAVDLEAEES